MSIQPPSFVRARLSDRHPVAGALRTAAFWCAIVLPLSFLPLLYGGVGGWQLPVFFGLALLNVACLVVGHGHRPRA